MKSKKSIITLLSIIFPLIIAIGFSSWIIVYEVIVKPIYNEPIGTLLSDYFDAEQVVTYNASSQLPLQKAGTEEIQSLQYSYKTFGSSDEYVVVDSTNQMINAGHYDVKIECTDASLNYIECKVDFTIEVKSVRIKQTPISVEYTNNDGQDRYWAGMQSIIKSNVVFLDNNGIYAMPDDCFSITGMQNGVYYYSVDTSYKNLYSSTLKTTTNIAGSTYLATVKLTNDNYAINGNNTAIVKYKTVKVNSTLYTIEDAINEKSDNNIVLLGDETNSSSYVLTCFSKILDTNTYSIKKRKLTIPYNSAAGDYKTDYQDDNSSDIVYSALQIPSDITINVMNTAIINVSALIKASANVTRRGVVMNDGIINVDGGCYYKSYGFTKGSGTINLKNGATALDVFRIYDWPGADEALDLKNANAFPVKQWSVYNISCKSVIYNGAKYNSMSYVVVVSGFGKIEINDVYVVGDINTTNCLFKPLSTNPSSGYILKYATIPNDSFTKKNQVYDVKNTIEIHGNYEDATVKLNIKYIINYSFETSTSLAIPIDYYSIEIKDSSSLILSSSSYILLSTNASISVDNSSSLTINGSAYLACMNNGFVTINGELNGTGKFGGIIKTDEASSVLSISNYGVTGVVLKTSSTTHQSYDVAATGKIGSNGTYTDNSNFSTGSLYYSELASDNTYYFVGGTNFNTYTINYNTNGGDVLAPTVIYSFDDSYIVNSSTLSTPNKMHYDFVNWHSSSTINDSTIFDSTTLTSSNNSITVYAEWTLHTYSFAYQAGIKDAEGNITYVTNNVTFTNKLETFTIDDFVSSTLSITTTATYNNMFFNGWYVGVDDSTNIKINSITISNLELFVSEYGDNMAIPLFCYFSNVKEYTIHFVDNNKPNKDPSDIQVIEGSTFELPTFNSEAFDNNENYPKYFAGWYLDSSYTTEVTSNTIDDYISYANSESKITMYA
ncbi:MAG: InlB B-repeat-containing protein, partial [Erysipelotrichaceae bacterium]|nr:InlB B-repeat-containing protein [Erysipelotrichaceae bacterium]